MRTLTADEATKKAKYDAIMAEARRRHDTVEEFHAARNLCRDVPTPVNIERYRLAALALLSFGDPSNFGGWQVDLLGVLPVPHRLTWIARMLGKP